MRTLVLLSFALLALTPTASSAEQAGDHGDIHTEHAGGHHYHCHPIAVCLGAGTEIGREAHAVPTGDVPHEKAESASSAESQSSTAGALGLEYMYSINRKFGVGVLWERLGEDALRESLVMIPISWKFVDRARLVVAGGAEFKGDKDEWVLRTGLGYAFPVSARVSIVPEAFVDFLEGGHTTAVYGAAMAYGF